MQFKYVKDYLVYGLGQFINLSTPLIVTPILINNYGIDKFGEISVAFSVFLILSILVDFGSSINGVKMISSFSENELEIFRYLNQVISLKIIITFSILLLTIIGLIILDIENKFLFAGGLFILLGQLTNVNWIYQGIEKFNYINYINFFSKSIYLTLIIIFTNLNLEYSYILFLFGTSNLLVNTYFLNKIFKDYNLKINLSDRKLSFQFIEDLPIVVSNLSITYSSNITILFVKYFLGDFAAGIFKIGDTILGLVKSYLAVFFNVSFPKFCKKMTLDYKEGFQYFKRINNYNLVLIIFINLILILIIKLLIQNTNIEGLAPEYFLYYSVFPLIGIVISMNIPFYQTLLFFNHQKVISFISFVTVVVVTISGYFGLKYFNLYGSLFALLLAEIVNTGLFFYFYKKFVSDLVKN
ncbi:MAG: oligosaccharide flippase family protein [Flavobacterium sp.]